MPTCEERGLNHDLNRVSCPSHLPKCGWRAPTLQQLGSCLRAPVFFLCGPENFRQDTFLGVKSPGEDASDAFTGRMFASRTPCHLQRAAASSVFQLSESKLLGKMSLRRCRDSSPTDQTFSLIAEGACLNSRTTEPEVLLNNGRILFTFIARLRAALERVSARSQDFAADSKSASVSNFQKAAAR